MASESKKVPGAIDFEARSIPVPASISEQARAYLTMMASAPRAMAVYPPAKDKDAWRKYVAMQNETMKPMLGMLQSIPAGVVETIEMNGATVHHARPRNLSKDNERRAILEFHPGALVLFGGEFCKAMAGGAAERHGVSVYSVDYRMPPEHYYPAALDDGLSAYTALLKSYSPSDIVVHGASAGGNLAAATVLRARDMGLPLPAGVALMTPMTDLTEAGDSFETLRDLDVMLRGRLYECGALYANGADLKSPYLSPNFADYTKGFPRTFLQSGTRDLYLSNTVTLHRAMRRAGVEADLHIWEAMPHGGFGGQSPEDADVAVEVRQFLAKCWGNDV